MGAARGGRTAGFESPSLILPSATTQAQRQRDLPDAATLAQRVAEAARGLPFRAGLFEPFLQDVAQARQAPLLRPADLAGTGLRLRLEALLSPAPGRLGRRAAVARRYRCQLRGSGAASTGARNRCICST